MPRDAHLATVHRQLIATTERLLREHGAARLAPSPEVRSLCSRTDEHLQTVLVHLPAWERRDD